MSERDSGFAPSQVAPDTAPTPEGAAAPALHGSSPGAMLRQLREAAGVDPARIRANECMSCCKA